MKNKNDITNKFNVDEVSTNEIIKKGKYRVFNGKGYDTVHLQTSADQVMETEDKLFVSQEEKNTWSNKSDASHNHDKVYAKIDASHTKSEMKTLLEQKANKEHNHAPSDIIQNSSYRFVKDSEKDRWNDTYTKADADAKVKEVNDAVTALATQNASDHTSIIQAYKAADKLVEAQVATVQTKLTEEVERLTGLINSGETANEELAAKVHTMQNITIPEVKNQIVNVDSKFAGITDTLKEDKADKTKVTEEINAAKSTLQANINLKADKTYVNDNLLLKANVTDIYSKEYLDGQLESKAATSYVDAQLNKKVDTSTFTSALELKANTADVNTELDKKASIEALTSGLDSKAAKVHKHEVSEIKGLGDVATLNVGVNHGNVPILNENGQLETSVLPSIAINKKVIANNPTEAMTKKMDIGDILILTSNVRETAIEKQEKGEAITYQVAQSKKYQELSDEYTTYLASGRMTYLCVDSDAPKFEDRFKPLQSSGDTISAAEVQDKLNLKVNTSDFDNYKNHVTTNLNLKADQLTTYTKIEVDNKLDTKVTKEDGKQLSANDFTTILKNKLEGIAEKANHYTHPTGDGHFHVPEIGTTHVGKFLMAGSIEGAPCWIKPNAGQIDETATRKYVTPTQIEAWTNKAEKSHTHDDRYRLLSDSFDKNGTRAEINKMKTIISNTQPAANTHIAGAVWIEEIKS